MVWAYTHTHMVSPIVADLLFILCAVNPSLQTRGHTCVIVLGFAIIQQQQSSSNSSSTCFARKWH